MEDFACYKEFRSFKVEVDYNNSKVCLNNWNLISNRITIHFLCLSNCPMEGCDRVYNFVSSHQILISKYYMLLCTKPIFIYIIRKMVPITGRASSILEIFVF